MQWIYLLSGLCIDCPRIARISLPFCDNRIGRMIRSPSTKQSTSIYASPAEWIHRDTILDFVFANE